MTGLAEAGWVGRVAIVWTSLVLVWVSAGLFRAQVLAPRLPFDAWRAIESLLAGALGVAVIVLACRVLDRRTLASIGFGLTRGDLAALGIGAALWTGLAAVGLFAGAIAGAITVSFGPPTWQMVAWILLQIFLVFVYEALPEELALRGYIYTNLAERMSRWLAVLLQAMLFMLWAFALVGLLQLLGVGGGWSINIDRAILFLTFGVSLALVRLWTGSLWGSIGYHLAFQVGMGLLSLDRLTVVRVPASDIASAGIVLWATGIVLGGVIALVELWSAFASPRDRIPRFGRLGDPSHGGHTGVGRVAGLRRQRSRGGLRADDVLRDRTGPFLQRERLGGTCGRRLLPDLDPCSQHPVVHWPMRGHPCASRFGSQSRTILRMVATTESRRGAVSTSCVATFLRRGSIVST